MVNQYFDLFSIDKQNTSSERIIGLLQLIGKDINSAEINVNFLK